MPRAPQPDPLPRRHRSAASTCLTAFMIPVGLFGWFAVDATAAVAAQPDRVETSAAPKAPHQVPGNAGYDPRTLPGLPAGTATGPLVPTLSGVTLDGKLGLSTSLTPALSWPNGPTTDVTFKVADLAGKVIWTQSLDGNTTRVPPNRLKQGGVYEWSATAGGATLGPFQVRVDIQRAAVQPLVTFGSVSVAGVTGEAVLSLSTPTTRALAGPVGVTLAYRPSESQSITPSAGVPAGWRVSSTGDAPWSSLRRVSPNRLDLYSADGQVVPFRQSSPGAWIAVWGKGQDWPAGTYATLSQAVGDGTADGDFQVIDRNGEVTTFPATAVGKRSHPSGSWSARSAALRTAYDADGRLLSLTDPVSGRSAVVQYGGSGKCPTPAGGGLKKAPKGMLCRVQGWDGSVSEVFYRATDAPSGPVIARFVANAQASGQNVAQTDIGYDAAGRPSAVRNPIANAAVASGVLAAAGVTAANADDGKVLTSIAYDSSGRVRQVLRPSALVAGSATTPDRGERTFDYPSPGALRVMAPGRDQPLSEAVASPGSMLVKSGRDSGGRLQTTTWDSARQAVTQHVEPGGLTTLYRYGPDGAIVESSGPSQTPQAGNAPLTRFAYDTQIADDASPGTPARAITGLQATVWKGTEFAGLPWKSSVGPRIAGATPTDLAYSWTDVTRTPYSARLEGTVIVPKAGLAAITNALPAAQVWIDGTRCVSTCPSSLDLPSRPAGSQLSIRVDLRSSAAGTGAVNVQWTPKGGTQGPIPSTALRPGLPQPTATAVRDQVRSTGSIVELTMHSRYSSANPSQIVGARSASGLTTTRSYEAYDPAAGKYGRATGAVTAAKENVTTAYYAVGEKAATTSCPGASSNQGGLPKSFTTPGGRSVVNSYDAAGRVIGQKTAGVIRTCTTYDATGNPLKVTTTGAASDGSASTVAYDYAPDANPLATRQSFPGTGTAAQVSTTDLLGRTVTMTDSWGTTVSMAYDALDEPVAATTRTAGGEQTTINSSYNLDGSVNTVSRDGEVLSESSYQASTGLLQSVSYANGAALSMAYDSQGNATSRSIAVDGQMLSDTATVSPAARTLGRTIRGPGGADASWQYGYDRDGRLTTAVLAGTMPTDVRAGTWSYALNAASQRTSITSPYTVAGGYKYSYAGTGAITATTDPRFTAGFAYDAAGRATKAGPLALSYDAQGVASRISDGEVTETRTVLPNGDVVAESITSGGTTRTARNTLGGLLLDTAGRITSQIIALPGAVSVQLPPPAASGTATWRYADLQGSVAWEGAGGSAPATTSLYDPDGNRLNGAALSVDPSRPNLLFNAQGTAPTSLPVTHMGQRDYVAALGVFLQPDPVPASSSTPYNYAGSDPINAQDPSGGFFLFDGQWWKDNGGAFLKVAIAVVVTAAVSAATAGAATGPTVAVLGTIASGAVAGAAGNALGQVAENAINGKNPLSIDWAEVGVSAGIGAATGAIFGGVKAVRLVKAGRGGAGAAAGQAGARQSVQSSESVFLKRFQQAYEQDLRKSKGGVIMGRPQSASSIPDDEFFLPLQQQQQQQLAQQMHQQLVGSPSSSGDGSFNILQAIRQNARYS